MGKKSGNKITFLKNKKIAIKSYGVKERSWKSVKYYLINLLGFAIPIEYQSPKHRKEFEHKCLRLWNEKGFSAPVEIKTPNNINLTGIYLAQEKIIGKTLHDLLADDNIENKIKWKAIKSIFQEIRKRHCVAIYEENHLLIHYDSNSRNIMLSKNHPIFIDFEMGHLTERIDKSAAREVKKLTLEIANAIDYNLFSKLVGILFSDYGIIHVLRRCSEEELHRRFSSHHIKRDQKRKRNNPNLITKIDFANSIYNYLNPDLNNKKVIEPNNSQQKALDSSWDGKFYQSFDDNDLRGRNMLHRYEVMQFPKSFSGKKVLDLGCNIGRICIDTSKRGAIKSVGVDYRQDVMNAVNSHCVANNIDAKFYQFDINNGVSSLYKTIGKDTFDVVFILAIWSHVEKQKLWDIVNSVCNEVCYFEDNAPSRIKSVTKIKKILEDNLKFKKVEFMGYTTDRGIRSVFRLSNPSANK
jgi:2-polyprenyl-3-methyl-5-hydroxy-6-metoxy-1,4-benzoquinol methylase/tRNA A-37 threonylcarbamoyl transferase component Bud32